MKITTKILCQRVKGPLSEALHLDISGLGIGALEGLENCPNLQSLDLSRNCLEEFENFECCKHLWRINLSDNMLKCLGDLSKICAIGVLDLSNNQLSWKDLIRIRHVHILDLRLHGNQNLENDTYYRLHVVDSLPNVWMLDGRLITYAERLQVRQFFDDSALSKRPIRSKFNENSLGYTRTTKHTQMYGCRTAKFSARFPANEDHSNDTDKRRLEFLAENIEEDLKNRHDYMKRPSKFLSDRCLPALIKNRSENKERCNMLLLLLVASVEFELPTRLIKETLEVARLNPLFGCNTLDLFDLDPASRTEVISLLVSSCKLDKDMSKPSIGNFTSGGLYDRLYLCLYHSVEHLVKKTTKIKKKRLNKVPSGTSQFSNFYSRRPHTAPVIASFARDTIPPWSKKQSQEWKCHQNLLASELVLLLSVVPCFYQLISSSDLSVCRVLRLATGDCELSSRLSSLAQEINLRGGNINSLNKELCQSVLSKIERFAMNSTNSENAGTRPISRPNAVNKFSSNTKQARFILSASSAYPKRPKSATIASGERLSAGRSQKSASSFINFIKPYDLQNLTLGSWILLGPQNFAKVIAIPEPQVALVQMDLIPGPNGSVTMHPKNAEEHFCYVDVRKLKYDHQCQYWKPRGAVGDKITLQTSQDFAEEEAPCADDEAPFTPPAIEYHPIDNRNESSALVLSPFSSKATDQSKESISPTHRRYQNTPESTKHKHDHKKNDRFKTEVESPNSIVQKPLSSLYCEKMHLSLSNAPFQKNAIPRLPLELHEQRVLYMPSENISFQSSNTFTTQLEPGELTPTSPTASRKFGQEASDRNFSLDNSNKDFYPKWSDKNPVESFLKNQLEFRDKSDEGYSDRSSIMDEKFNSLILRTPDQISVVDMNKEQKLSSSPPVNIPMTSDDPIYDEDYVYEINSKGDEKEVERGLEGGVLGSGREDVIGEVKEVEETVQQGRLEEGEAECVGEEQKVEAEGKNEEPESKSNDGFAKTAGDKKMRSRSALSIKKKSSLTKDGPRRPASAVIPQQKHVIFDSRLRDSAESRPGSASSFQLKRTEAWRSSASSSAGFNDNLDDQLDKSSSSFGMAKFDFAKFPRAKFSLGVRQPPPQRPTSPDPYAVNSKLFSSNQSGLVIAPTFNDHLKVSNTPKNSIDATSKHAPTKGHRPGRRTGSLLGSGVHFDKRISTELPGFLEGTSIKLPNTVKKSSLVPYPRSGIASNFPPKPANPLSRLPYSSYKKSHRSSQDLSSSTLGAAIAWHRPRFSPLSGVKKLSAKQSIEYLRQLQARSR